MTHPAFSAFSAFDAQTFNQYLSHTANLWSSRATFELEERDYTVMGLGLPGEFGELVEELQRDVVSRTDVVKEAGDVIYYLARIAHAFDLRAEDLLTIAATQPYLDSRSLSFESLAAYAYRGIGQVCEALKKRVRDGLSADGAFERFETKLTLGLAQVLLAWLAIADKADIAPQDVLNTNLEKLYGRRARGTVHGDGNHR